MSSEIVFTCAYPAAGKSSFTDYFRGHRRLNRDTIGGTLADVAAELDKQLRDAKHNQFILDNTYCTKAHRKQLVDVAKKHKVPLRCVWLKTSLEDCMVNACQRMVRKFGRLPSNEEIAGANSGGKSDPNTFPIALLYKFRKEFEEPEESEGFKLEFMPFVRKKDPCFASKAILLDFDGTLRKTKSGAKFPVSKDDIEILPGRQEVLKGLKKQGYFLLGVSNQSGVAKGDLTLAEAQDLFDHTNKLLGIDIDVSFCPHKVPPICCYCRKPGPGIGVAFIEKYKLDPAQCIMVGDMTTDKSFAARCGFKFSDQAEMFGK